MATDANVLLQHPGVKEILLQAFAGSADLREFGARVLELMINALMSIQAEELCNAGYGERTEARVNSRNGYRERGLSTTMGDITLQIPKLRSGSYFPEDIVSRYSRSDTALAAAVAEMYVKGVSTRNVEAIAHDLGVSSLSKSQVSRLTAELDAEVAAFRERSLDGERYAYLWLDATYVKCRVGGASASCALVTAVGLEASGSKRFLGLDVVDAESYADWREFLCGLRERGLKGVRLVVSDDHAGLVRAVGEVMAGAAWQRCTVHLKRNVLDKVHTRAGAARACAALRAAFEQKDALLVRACYRKATEVVAAESASAGRLLADAEQDALAYLAFPRAHWRRLRTNNVQERANREIKRRYRVVQSFPSAEAAIRLMGALLAEEDERWAARKTLSVESTAQAWEERPEQLPGEEEVEAARAAAERIIAAALEEAAAGE